MEGREGVVGEEVAVGAAVAEAEADVLSRVLQARGLNEEAVVDAGQQRAMGSCREAWLELGQAHEDDG